MPFLRPADLRRLKNLLFFARTLVEGYYAGRHRSPFRGHSVEFADYREYCPGDDIADIDWRAFGRTDRLFIKLFEAQTDMVVYPLLDTSASMDYAGLRRDGLSKLDYARFLVAALAYLVVQQGDKVALGMFRSTLDAFIPPGGTFSHLHGMLHRLEQRRPRGETNIAQVLKQAFGVIRRRGLLVIVSDLLEDPEPLWDALHRYRHRRFDILVFHVLHEDEVNLPDATNVRFVDSETNAELTTAVPEVRAAYKQRLDAHIDALRTGCAARRVDYNLVTTATPYYTVLERYLARRARGGAL